jgi:hypothetical protein
LFRASFAEWEGAKPILIMNGDQSRARVVARGCR